MTQHCLNCEKELTDHYCSGCGQKADIHRISFKHFVFHDVLHGAFHIDKGMLFTAKEALQRPGKAALDYIAGKRIRYYNVFYLILITIGLIIFFRHFYEVLDPSEAIVQNQRKLNLASKTMDDLIAQRSKIIIFLFVPLSALNAFVLLRRKKLNLSEHCIVAGMILLGMLLISLFGNLFFYLELIVPFHSTFSAFMSWLVTALIIFHIVYGYFDAFAADYSKLGIAYRIALMLVLTCLEVLALFLIVFGLITDWKFGAITVSPFN